MARSDYEHLSRDQLLTVIERLEAVLLERDARIVRQDARIARLEAHVAKLEQLLDDAARGGKR